jgi:lysophospholipase L1-like esterase
LIAFPERFRLGSYCIVATIALLCAVAIGFLHFRAQDRRLMSVLRQQQRDWPQIQYYTIANQEWLADGPHDGAIVFLGDSVTQLWDLHRFFPGRPYVNRGIEAQTTAQMLLRFRADVIALHPRCVVILGGTNDVMVQVPQQLTTDNIASMAELARANGIAVILSSVLPVGNSGPFKARFPQATGQIRILNWWIRTYAARSCYSYVDYFSGMADPDGSLNTDLSHDGLHPAGPGYQVMAKLAQSAIAQLNQTNPLRTCEPSRVWR